MVALAECRPNPAAIAVICVLLGAHAARAETTSQTQAGLDLARRYCAECHVVQPSASKGWTDAPRFQDIANRPGTTAANLSTFIQQPQMHMLNTGRPRQEANQIAAYIVSLHGTQPPDAK